MPTSTRIESLVEVGPEDVLAGMLLEPRLELPRAGQGFVADDGAAPFLVLPAPEFGSDPVLMRVIEDVLHAAHRHNRERRLTLALVKPDARAGGTSLDRHRVIRAHAEPPEQLAAARAEADSLSHIAGRQAAGRWRFGAGASCRCTRGLRFEPVQMVVERQPTPGAGAAVEIRGARSILPAFQFGIGTCWALHFRSLPAAERASLRGSRIAQPASPARSLCRLDPGDPGPDIALIDRERDAVDAHGV